MKHLRDIGKDLGLLVDFSRKKSIALASLMILVVATSFLLIELVVLPNQVHTLGSITIRQGPKGNYTFPGFTSLAILNIGQGEKWAVSIIVNGTHTYAPADLTKFCVIADGTFEVWARMYNSTLNPGSFFPYSQCIAYAYSLKVVDLGFEPSWSGTWDVVVLNEDNILFTVYFYPLTNFPGITRFAT